jgi:hypothetical protein
LRPKPKTKVKTEPVVLRPEPSSSDQDIHAQILASLQGQKEATAEVEQATEQDKVRGNRESPRQTRPAGPNAEIGEKLHGLVEVSPLSKVSSMLTCCLDDTGSSPGQRSSHLPWR